MTTTPPESLTLLEAVRASLGQAVRYNPGDVVAPAAVLWTDADGQWRAVVEQLRTLMPELLTLGEYDPETRTGPAIWLRCVIEPEVRSETFPTLAWPADTVPVIYLPDVSRQTLGAVEECPDMLKPLVELQYRGAVWTQKNGKDWTIRAFMVNAEEGLGLDVAEDKHTHRAMLGALSQLAVTPLTRLQGRRLGAEDFDKLMIGDTPRDLLLWLSDPPRVRSEWDDAKWTAFRSRCKGEYGFDPEDDGEIVGGEKLGQRKDGWLGVWQRFTESPALYPGIPDLLRKAKPSELFLDRDAWPDESEAMEEELRRSLLQLASINPPEARERIAELETEHGVRRDWVWAKLGMCPLAEAVAHLAVLAKRTVTTLGGESPDTMAKLYAEGDYLADDAVLRALACVKTAENLKAIHAAVQCMYLPWVEDTARNFQKCVAGVALPDAAGQKEITVDEGECILFADGLRFDLSQRLVIMAVEQQMEATSAWRWAGLPTVTATAKPAVSPVGGKLVGHKLGGDFLPEIADVGQSLNTDRFRKLLAAGGYDVFGAAEAGTPRQEGSRGWTEYGEFDKLGHDLQSKLAARIDDQLERLLERIRALLDAGWKRIRVVTDHGWLLVPGGLPTVKLPKYLTESRWSRCASIKDSSHVEVPVADWHWNPHERFAFAPGAHCFIRGNEYAHGGVSLQECLIPDMAFVSTTEVSAATATVTSIQWLGLRCRVIVEASGNQVVADIRTKPNDSNSSIITSAKAVDSEGRVGLLVKKDELEGTAVSLVLLDPSGRVIAKKATTVGGDE